MNINIYFDGQLIYASLKLTYKGKSKSIDKLIVDTGAAKSFISVDAVYDIDITFEDNDYTWLIHIGAITIASDPVLCPKGTIQNYQYFNSTRLNAPAFTE